MPRVRKLRRAQQYDRRRRRSSTAYVGVRVLMHMRITRVMQPLGGGGGPGAGTHTSILT